MRTAIYTSDTNDREILLLKFFGSEIGEIYLVGRLSVFIETKVSANELDVGHDFYVSATFLLLLYATLLPKTSAPT